MIYHYTFEINPIPKGRARMGMVRGHARVFTPKKTRQYEKELAYMAKEARILSGALMFTKAIEVQVTFFLERPKTVKRPHVTVKPDLDNLVKSLDALNGILWEDDAQIVAFNARKEYGSPPRIEITISDELEGH